MERGPGPTMAGPGSAGNAAPPFFAGPERYYPTVTALPDGRMLVTGGAQIIEGSFTPNGGTPITFPTAKLNLSIEAIDVGTGASTVLSATPARRCP